MQETKDPKSTGTTAASAPDEDSEATSSETLSDVEEKEEVSDAGHEDESSPSPDGAFDESRERDDAGPM